jgi:glycosyltransferase involved in cell wall biosynthesis
LKKERILFIIKERVHDSGYGITSGLYNSAQFVVNFLLNLGIESKLVSVADGNSVDREVTKYNPDIVVLEALWVTPAKLQELVNIKRHQKRRWVIRIHSKAPFLANEGVATAWIRDYTRIKSPRIFLAPNTSELTNQLKSVFPKGKFITLPNLYQFKNRKIKTKKESNTIDIACFGAIRPMKNQYQQAIAAIEFANKRGLNLRFHINGTRVEQKGENVLKNIRLLFIDKHELVEHGWMDHQNFLEVISTMDVGCQVSFSESFNIVSADFVQAGVPIVVSDDIEWMPSILRVSPTDSEKISRKIYFANKFKKILVPLQRFYLKWYGIKAELMLIYNFLVL